MENSFHPTYYNGCHYLSMLGLRLIHCTWNSFWFNSLQPRDACIRYQTRPSLVQIMVCRLFGAKPLSQPMLDYCPSTHGNIFQWNLNQNTTISIEDSEFQNVVRKSSAILSRPQCVNDAIWSRTPWSCNGLSPVRHQVVTWTKADLSSVWPLRTNRSDIWINTNISSIRKCINMD